MDEKDRQKLKIRLVFVGLAVLLVFSSLVTRLWHLQIAEASTYVAKSKGNILRTVSIPAPRGDIVDSKGMVLATSEPRFAVTLDWLDLQNAPGKTLQQVISKLAGYVKPFWSNPNESIQQITEDILAEIQMQQFARYENVVVMQNIPQQLQAILAEHQNELPGISVEALPYRVYPQQTLFGHILGYVRQVTASELPGFQARAKKAGLDPNSYQAGDTVGQMGVEDSYDLYLRGTPGEQVLEVDNQARPVDMIKNKEPVAGDTVQLTVDSAMQKAIGDAMDQVISDLKKTEPAAGAGAAVVLDVKTGKILAMVSKPSMNPNDLTGTITPQIFNEYFGNSQQGPRLAWNRAIQSLYAPGSTFKLITGMAALQTGKITPTQPVHDALSTLALPSAGVADWYSGSMGDVNMYKAYAESINIYFEYLGQLVMQTDPQRLSQVAHEFGLGEYTGVDIPSESQGIAPSPDWKMQLNGPRLKQVLADQLQQIEAKAKSDLAKAKTTAERKAIQSNEKKLKDLAMEKFNYNFKWEAQWQWYDTYNTAIGQGDNKYTILQLVNYVATVVNGGHHMQPYVVDKVIDPRTGKLVLQNEPKLLNNVDISPQNLNYVKEGMNAVVGSGTAAGIFTQQIPNFTGGAKTGTAQLGNAGTAEANVYNGTFIAFTPYNDPQIAFAGVIEHGLTGGSSAGQVAVAAFKEYYQEKGWLPAGK